MPKVLVVEDDNNLREIYETSLKAEGYETFSAPDGMEAIEVATRDKPDLIISDVMMPRLSGFEMLEKMRQDENLKDIPVIMMTALSMAEDKETAKRLGVVHYLVKSQVTLEDFVNVAKKFISPDGQTAATTPAPVADPVVADEPVVTPAPEPPKADEPVKEDPVPEPAPVVEEPTQPAPVADPVVADEPVVTPAVTTPPSQSTDEASDDIEAQIQDFVDTPASESSDSKTAPIETPASAPPVANTSAPATDSSGKKIIEPIANPNKKDIHELAKEEEVKQTADEPVKPPTAGSSVDPNSIAL